MGSSAFLPMADISLFARALDEAPLPPPPPAPVLLTPVPGGTVEAPFWMYEDAQGTPTFLA